MISYGKIYIQISALKMTNCVSMPQFPYLWNGGNNNSLINLSVHFFLPSTILWAGIIVKNKAGSNSTFMESDRGLSFFKGS